MVRIAIRAVALTVMLLSGPGAALAEGSATKGKAFSEQNCARCHVVSEETRYGGIGSTPSFFLLAGLGDSEERFLTFYERRPHPAFTRMEDSEKWTDLPSPIVPFEMTLQDLEDVMAYAETLKQE